MFSLLWMGKEIFHRMHFDVGKLAYSASGSLNPTL